MANQISSGQGGCPNSHTHYLSSSSPNVITCKRPGFNQSSIHLLPLDELTEREREEVWSGLHLHG